MTDLLRVLPHFPVGQYADLIPTLERHGVTTSDLLTLDSPEIGKRTHLPLLNIQRLCNAVLQALHADLGVAAPKLQQADYGLPQPQTRRAPAPVPVPATARKLKQTAASLAAQWQTISTLDASFDRALGGGIPAGYVTEITGESGAGKTQFLLTLLLAVQLPPPHGLGKSAMYISTEAPLSTRRLAQILNANPTLKALDVDSRPSLDNIMSQATPDLESQDHILTFQVPIVVERRNVGLIVLDSVAANFRAEFERQAGQARSSSMGARGAELVRLGMQLRELASKYNLAVVVANQVADRFNGAGTGLGSKTPSALPSSNIQQSSPLATRSKAGPPPNTSTKAPSAAISVEPTSSMADLLPRSSNNNPDHDTPMKPPPPPTFPSTEPSSTLPPAALLLDHQQRWFTGWGDDPYADYGLKTPSLGLVWSTQISARIALFKRPSYHSEGVGRYALDDEGEKYEEQAAPTVKSWRRWMKVVFAPHAAASAPGLNGAEDEPVEYEVTMGGVRAIESSQ
ncbi:P-loop containing nucleoside triphosphate hydrolase protein [Cercophora newfieldiana]|uniref:P-loop containing nucleoside triphosphate hydrolase protein n=1 Tax=Cercophora newfieldiana TaxID=92897 RepID=A0AA40CUR6_9PEZI|nr:P-loop containing nucleoside triphosphate hydrolase protein [Cercophora newfieldiana]